MSAGRYLLNDSLALGPEDSGRDGFVVRWIGAQAGRPWCRVPPSSSFNSDSTGFLATGSSQWAASCDQRDQTNATVLSVGTPVESWEPPAAGSKAWTGKLPSGSTPLARFPSDLADSFGTVRTRARTPDLGQFFVWADTVCKNVREPPCTQLARRGFVYAPGQVPDSFSQPQHTRMVLYHGWTDSSHSVKSVFPENRTVLLTNPADRPIGYWPNHDSEGGGRYFYESLESLDSRGEWYFDWAGQQPLYIPEAEGENPNDMGFVLSGSTEVIAMEGAHDIEIDGISARHASWHCDYEGQQVCDRQSTAWQHYAAINIGVGSRRVAVRNTEVAGSGGPGVWASANVSGVTIEGCSIHDLGGGGIRVGFDNDFLSGYERAATERNRGAGGAASGYSHGVQELRAHLLSGNVSADSYCHGKGNGLAALSDFDRQSALALAAGMPAPPGPVKRLDSMPSSSSHAVEYLQAATDVTVRGNVVFRGGLTSASGTGIVAQWAMNSTFEHNELHSFAYAGFSVGWCWNYADPSGSGGNSIRGNYVHDLGTGTYRQLGDAMAAFYTLGVQTGTEFTRNLGHDVYASYTGGYGLSQDQGSSNINFTGNVLARINAAPQTQHYGMGQSYENNMFLYGMLDASTFRNTPALRSVCPLDEPSNYRFVHNIVAFSNATDNETFHGGFDLVHPDGQGSSSHHFDFVGNCYWNYARPASGEFEGRAVWGGCSAGYCSGSHEAEHLTFKQWQGGCGTGGGSSPTNCTGPRQDEGGVVADPGFKGDGPMGLSFELADTSPCFGAGF